MTSLSTAVDYGWARCINLLGSATRIRVNLQATTENASLSTLLDFIINLITRNLSFYLFLPLLACIYLNNAWDLVLWALPLSVCLFKMNRFMYSPIVSRFKSICKMNKCKCLNGFIEIYSSKKRERHKHIICYVSTQHISLISRM